MSDNSQPNETQKPVETQTYTDRTHRIEAWSKLIKSIVPYIWVLVILVVVIPLIGRGVIAGTMASGKAVTPEPKAKVAIVDRTLPPQDQLDRALVSALQDAKIQARTVASAQLDAWVEELMVRVDENFIPWYFNYFNQKKLEFKTPFVYLSSAIEHWINTKNPPAKQAIAEQITQNFQSEFAKRVLRPQIAQLELERITRDTVTTYISNLEKNVSKIQSRYQIPQGDWERYLGDIALTINDNGSLSNLSLKVLVGGSSYLLVKGMIPVVTKVGGKVVTALAGKAAAKMAAKTGGTVAAKVGAEFLNPIVGVGIILWDLWDYQHTVNVSKPILRAAIQDYLAEVKDSLLEDFETGIMASIYQVEGSILKSI